MNKKFVELVRWFVAVVIGFISMLVWGCSAKTVTVTEYQRVEVPVKCKVIMPAKPSPDGDMIELTYKILQYANELEAALNICK